MSKVKHLVGKIMQDDQKRLFKVLNIRCYSYKREFPKIDATLENMKDGKRDQIKGWDYGDFIRVYTIPDPFVTEVLFGAKETNKTDVPKR